MMDQKYVITRLVLGQGAIAEIGISETEFDTLKVALLGLRQAHSMEKKFDIVMEDYVELEKDLLFQLHRNVVFSVKDIIDAMISLHSRLNRRFIHLLSSSNMYIDQTKHDFSTLLGKESKEVFERSCSQEFDNFFGYRVCQLLRNLSLHQSLPIGGPISYHLPRQEDCIEFSLAVNDVKCAEKLNKKVTKEIVEIGQEHIPLKPLVRDYVSSLGRIHRKVREILAPAIKTWEADSRNAVERFCAKFGDDIRFLAIARIRLEDGREQGVLESYYLNDSPSEGRKQLECKNAKLENVAAHRIEVFNREHIMTTLAEIETAVISLSKTDFTKFRDWFDALRNHRRDQEFEADAAG